jgi:hypothetical protein
VDGAGQLHVFGGLDFTAGARLASTFEFLPSLAGDNFAWNSVGHNCPRPPAAFARPQRSPQ